METAFVLISCEVGTSDAVTKKLQLIDEVKDAISVWASFDVVAKVTASTRDVIRKKIRTIDNIRATMSLMVTESQT